MTAYYNETDPKCAHRLRNLIAAGLIAPGDVDERSIEDVSPDDLTHYTQCHFFAGVGVWSYALRRAGWSDDLPVWTGSCPCQPFSAAGKGAGFTDERHLWPAFHWLIEQCLPSVIFGEQVASKAVEPWIDLVHTDLEALDYAFGCVPFPSAGVGAPMLRDRAYWVADTSSKGCAQQRRQRNQSTRSAESSSFIGLAYAAYQLCERSGASRKDRRLEHPDRRVIEWLADSNGRIQRETRSIQSLIKHGFQQENGCTLREDAGGPRLNDDRRSSPGPTNGFWRSADWLFCRDGRWRPVEPGTFPLANVSTERVGEVQSRVERLGFSEHDIKQVFGRRNSVLSDASSHRAAELRAYGNAINAEAATAFIESWKEARLIA